MRNSRIGINIASSLLQQAVSVICGFIVPRLILSNYGSAYNGIVSSVSHFLSCITLLRAGIGGVTRAALYKSLAENETEKTAAIVKATEHFMRKIALIFSVSLLLFAAVYPLLVKEEFDWLFSFTLVLILGVSTIIQYYFGITNQFLLHADQRLYVSNIWNTVSVILNALLSVLLIRAGVDIRLVKLGSAAAFSITPIMLYFYVRQRYAFKKKVTPDFGAIQQRWDAFAHQLAAFIHSNTDVVLLTLFANLMQVSVYTVYTAVTGGINTLILTAANTMEAALGKTIAQKEEKSLRQSVEAYELAVHIISSILFSCTAMLLVPFVMVYTRGVQDVNYNRPMVGYFMCLAYWISAIRLPYQNVIEASGCFKETKKYAIAEAVLNISTSCVFVTFFGIEGVLIGTIVAMTYRTLCYVKYAFMNILKQPVTGFRKRIFVSMLSLFLVFVPYFACKADVHLGDNVMNYTQWVVAAIVTASYVSTVIVSINCLFYRDKMRGLIKMLIRR